SATGPGHFPTREERTSSAGRLGPGTTGTSSSTGTTSDPGSGSGVGSVSTGRSCTYLRTREARRRRASPANPRTSPNGSACTPRVGRNRRTSTATMASSIFMSSWLQQVGHGPGAYLRYVAGVLCLQDFRYYTFTIACHAIPWPSLVGLVSPCHGQEYGRSKHSYWLWR